MLVLLSYTTLFNLVSLFKVSLFFILMFSTHPAPTALLTIS